MTGTDDRSAAGREGLNRPGEAAPRLLVERDGAVLVLTMDHPTRRNAFAMPIRLAMIDALDQAQRDKSVRAVVLAGKGAHFSAGGDIAGMEVNSALEGRERMRLSHQVVRLMVLGSLPIVAAVEGYCVGAGLSLACACDTIVAGEGAELGAGFGRIGLMADMGLPHTLPRRIGEAKARQMFLYHNRVKAIEAERIGLVDHLAPKGNALALAMEKARFLAEQAPAPMALTKQLLGEGFDRALEEERHFQSTLFLTADFAEGRAAFLGKRQPVFKGN